VVLGDVRFWHLAHIAKRSTNVRFRGSSGHQSRTGRSIDRQGLCGYCRQNPSKTEATFGGGCEATRIHSFTEPELPRQQKYADAAGQPEYSTGC
jgi:hypothetical protein